MEAVQKTLDILETFLDHNEEIGIAELSNLSGVNITTAYRITSDLVKRGYLRQKQKRGKYSLGVKLLEYHRAIQNNLKIGELSLPYLRELSQLCGEYSEVALMESFSAVTIAQVETTQALKIRNEIGERLPLHATSLGKLFLAYMSPDERSSFYSNGSLQSFSTNTITDIDRLEQEVRIIKQQGFAIDNEEYTIGVWAVATPIYDSNGSVAASLAIAAPSVRITDSRSQELIEMARNSAARISREMGYGSKSILNNSPA